jgi:hypothetical protein
VRGYLIALSVVAGVIIPASTALAALPQHPAAGAGSIGIRLLDGPSNAQAGLARTYIVGQLAPGAKLQRQVEIDNTTSSTQDVAVYAAGAGLRAGRFSFASNRTQNEPSSWTSLSRDTLRLLPGKSALDTLTVKVPKDAASGERYAVVWAQVSAPAAAGGGVVLVNRVGVREYLTIGPGGGSRANFAIGSPTTMRSANGAAVVVAAVRNSGKRTLDISGTLTLADGPGGLQAGPFPVELGASLAPGDSEPAIARLTRSLPRGPWRAVMRLRSGALQRAAAGTITLPRVPGVTTPPISSSSSAGTRFPITFDDALVALLAVTLAAVALVAVRRQRI